MAAGVTTVLALAAQLIHLALILAAAPLLTGAIQSAKARLLGRTGPSPLQPYRDLTRLLRKQPVVAEGASVLFHIAPAASLACMIVAAAMVPSFTLGMTTAPIGDLIVIAGLLAASRAALALAAMDVGTAFGGIGASRAMSFSVFAEPALILVIFTLALLAGSTNLDTVGAALRDNALGLRVSLALAAISTVAVALAETGRLPAGNPTSHLELAMVHEAMVLEHSAAQLAMLGYAAMLKLILWFTLIGAMFLPAGMADSAAPLGWPVGIFVWLAKLTLAGAALAVLETSLAKMRVFRVPEFLGVAVLLAVLAVVFLFVSQGFA